MTIFCTSDEVLDETIARKKFQNEEVVVTDLNRRFYVGRETEPEITKRWEAVYKGHSLPPVTLSEDDDRCRWVATHEEFLEKLRIFRDGLNDRAVELIKLRWIYELKEIEREKGLDRVIDDIGHMKDPFVYVWDDAYASDRGPRLRRSYFHPQLCVFERSARKEHDFILQLLKTKPIPQHLLVDGDVVNLNWAVCCGHYVMNEISQFCDRVGLHLRWEGFMARGSTLVPW